jgi:hypothetical protein
MVASGEHDKWAAIARKAATDQAQARARSELAKFTAATFVTVGEELHSIGHIFGDDPVSGTSPFGHGTDEVVAVSLLLRLGGELTSAIVDLFKDGRHYAAAALLRQMVEIEYLAWAFETREKDAERWLRSDSEQRRNFFTPAKLRQAADGKFRGKDYGYHCELGGHPVLPLGFYFAAMRSRLSFCSPICWGTQDEFGTICYAGQRETIGQCRCSSGRKRCPKDTLNGKRRMSSHFCHHQTPNQAMQRTASHPWIYGLFVCHLPFGCVARFTGLAVADLVSR